jgi:hypothetical protein
MAKPSESDPTLTRYGFTRAAHLSDETLQAIIDTISEGTIEGQACRQHGTSYTQFLSRVRKDPEWHKKLRAAEVLKMRELRRQARNLQSQHGEPHTAP